VWDLTPTVLDNGYFQALNRVTWEQRFMPEAGYISLFSLNYCSSFDTIVIYIFKVIL